MGRLAVVGTFFRRPWAVPRIAQAIREQSRQPDELWLMYELDSDAPALHAEDWGTAVVNIVRAVPPAGVVPPSFCINVALDDSNADLFTYLTDDSLPLPGKYEQMVDALDEHGAVYCSQEFGRVRSSDEWLSMPRGGGVRHANEPRPDPFCNVDHTQVGHRRSEDRWPLAMSELRHSDGRFFQALVARFGPLHPLPDVLDWTRQLPDGISSR